MSVLFSGLLGAAIAIIVGTFFQFFKARFEELSARCDEVAEAATAASLLSAEYWLEEAAADSTKLQLQEAKILGLQILINGMVTALMPRFTRATKGAVADQLVDLLDALTGGSFKQVPRAVDVDRARAAYAAASGLVVAVRNAQGARLKFSGLVVLLD